MSKNLLQLLLFYVLISNIVTLGLVERRVSVFVLTLRIYLQD